MNKIEALYIHIPFCNHICTYCDFYKMISKEDVKTKYIDYLCRELDMKKAYLNDIKTIYIGGGTPSSLSNELLSKLLNYILQNIDLNKVEEYTIEANPLDITDDFLNTIIKYKINRISIGVQSVREDKLMIMGRNHHYEDIVKAIDLCHKYNLNNINVDYMYGILDTIKSVDKELKALCALNITHISTYSLILEEHTVLYHKYQNNEFKVFDEDEDTKIYYHILKTLRKYGFHHYEISNFAIPGYESKHNQTYWNNCNYLGIGAASSYYISNTRYTNINNLNKYFKGIDDNNLSYSERIELSIDEVMSEEMMLGLRKIEGVNITSFTKRFNKDIFEVYPQIHNLIKQDLLILENEQLFIPEDKLYISNAIMLEFIK